MRFCIFVVTAQTRMSELCFERWQWAEQTHLTPSHAQAIVFPALFAAGSGPVAVCTAVLDTTLVAMQGAGVSECQHGGLPARAENIDAATAEDVNIPSVWHEPDDIDFAMLRSGLRQGVGWATHPCQTK